MTPGEHLSLPQRKTLSPRLVYYDACLPLESEFERFGARREFDLLIEHLLVLIEKAERTADDNATPLDDFLRELFAKFEPLADLTLGNTPLRDSLNGAVRDAVQGLSCQQCTPLELVCNGGRHDNEIVSKRGHCVGSLREFFIVAFEAAKRYYTHYSEPSALPAFPHVTFSTRLYNGKPHDFPVDYYVGGATNFDDSDHRKSLVILYIAINRFDISTYMAATYALFHECVAHAFSGLWPSEALRRVPAADDRFSEGWMDWIAFKVMEEVLNGEGLAGDLRHRIQFPSERLERGRNFHFARTNFRSPNKSRHAFQCADGQLAARKVLGIIQNRPQLCSDPWEALLEMSLRLNARADFTEYKRELFVAVMNLLPENEDLQIDADPLEYKICGFIVKYLKTKDLDELIERVCDPRLFN